MGNFYTNITLKGPHRDQIAAALEGRTAYVSPTEDGSTVIFDQQCEEQLTPELAALASELSSRFQCPALATMNHDDDVLWLEFFQSGESHGGEYFSAPGYFEGTDASPSGGDAAAMAAGFGLPQAAPEVERVLRITDEEGDYTFAMERHTELLRLLRLPGHASGSGYTYLREGEFPEGWSESDFIHVGEPAA